MPTNCRGHSCAGTSWYPNDERWDKVVDLGQQIRLAREQQAMTQAYVAQQLAVAPATIDCWEGGVAAPTPENLCQLEQLLMTPLLTRPDATITADRPTRRHQQWWLHMRTRKNT